jgi:glycine cleavage system H lipoate-binding protein
MMPQMNGIDLLHELRARGCSTPILMITGYPTIRTAVQAMRLGAVDYVAKPFTRKELLSPVKRALRLEDEPSRAEPADIPRLDSLLPGAVAFLPHHAWARFEQDGTFSIGIEQSFLRAAGTPIAITPREDLEMIEQGFVGIVLTSAEGDAHGVAMPLSGQVIDLNQEAFSKPSEIAPDTWLLRVLPSQLNDELPLLVTKA